MSKLRAAFLFVLDFLNAFVAGNCGFKMSLSAFFALSTARLSMVARATSLRASHPHGEHCVYRIVSFGAKEGERRLAIGLEEGTTDSVRGRIESINDVRHGEANGFALDTGDFVPLKPEGMRLLRLAVGDKVKAEGQIRPNLLGSLAVEASHVNGVSLGKMPKEIH